MYTGYLKLGWLTFYNFFFLSQSEVKGICFVSFISFPLPQWELENKSGCVRIIQSSPYCLYNFFPLKVWRKMVCFVFCLFIFWFSEKWKMKGVSTNYSKPSILLLHNLLSMFKIKKICLVYSLFLHLWIREITKRRCIQTINIWSCYFLCNISPGTKTLINVIGCKDITHITKLNTYCRPNIPLLIVSNRREVVMWIIKCLSAIMLITLPPSLQEPRRGKCSIIISSSQVSVNWLPGIAKCFCPEREGWGCKGL